MMLSRCKFPVFLGINVGLGIGCQSNKNSDSGPGQDSGPTHQWSISVLAANVGHLGQTTGVDCPNSPYQGSLCSIEQEQIIAASLADLRPDVVILGEVFDADLCDEDNVDGDSDLPCTNAPDREPYQQAQRLLGDDYTIACDDIAHRECTAVLTELGSMSQCAPGELCIGHSTTPDHPDECAETGGISSVSKVDAVVRDQPLTIINAHPINASSTATDPCRLAQYKQIFEDLPGDGPNLLGGDFNMDPYRFPDLFPSAEYWHTVVGEDQPFDAHNADDPEQPTTTWLDVATLDYVLSDFGTGTCEVLGVTDGTSRLDGSMEMMDHRAVLCTISQ